MATQMEGRRAAIADCSRTPHQCATGDRRHPRRVRTGPQGDGPSALPRLGSPDAQVDRLLRMRACPGGPRPTTPDHEAWGKDARQPPDLRDRELTAAVPNQKLVIDSVPPNVVGVRLCVRGGLLLAGDRRLGATVKDTTMAVSRSRTAHGDQVSGEPPLPVASASRKDDTGQPAHREPLHDSRGPTGWIVDQRLRGVAIID